MKKRMISLLIGAAMITGALAGTAMAEESGKALKIAILSSPSGVDDGSFNETSYNGILSFIESHPDCTVTPVKEETGDVAACIQTASDIVADYDVLVCDGFQFAAISGIAADNPDKYFIIVDTNPTDADGNEVTMDNVYGMSFKREQAGFCAGIAAALETTTGKVAVSTDLGKGEARVIAVGGDFFQFHPIWLTSGNYISQSDFMQDRVLLDEELAWLLFGGTELTGMQLKINGVPFVVAGVIQREQDVFSRRAYTDGMGLFMSFDAYRQLNEDAGIDCYEFVMGEPVKGFALNLTREKFPIGRGEILQNTGRFTFSRLWKILEAYGTRSMQTRGIIYPYWENACRSAEDECALFMLLGFLFAVYPLVLVTVALVHLFKSGKEKLTEEILPDVSDRVEEAVRVRQRRAWERQQERRGKHEK